MVNSPCFYVPARNFDRVTIFRLVRIKTKTHNNTSKIVENITVIILGVRIQRC